MTAETVRQSIKDGYQRLRQLEHQRNNPDWAASIQIDIIGSTEALSATIEAPEHPLSEVESGSFVIFTHGYNELDVWDNIDDFLDALLTYSLGALKIIVPQGDDDLVHYTQPLNWTAPA